MTNLPLLQITDLSLGSKKTLLLKNVSLHVHQNEVVALVGESGSGKSMLAKAIMGVLPSKEIRIQEGEIFFRSERLSEKNLQKIRGKQLSYIPQSPLSSLNPLMSIGSQLMETIDTSQKEGKKQLFEKTVSLLESVGFFDPLRIYKSYPHELSGGMRQRVLIALSLINTPALLIADEPTTALDVTLQSEIMQLLLSIKEQFGLGILFITHDLGLVAQIASRAIILKNGEIIEEGSVENVFSYPQKNYTKKLLNSLMPCPFLR